MLRVILGVALLCVLFASPLVASSQQPPLGSYVIGTDPAIFDAVAAGAAGWSNTGAVWFTVEATGCGTGDVTFCIAWPNLDYAVSEFDVDYGNLVRVNPAYLDRFTAAIACHELGHFLGLRWYADGRVYHRSDYQSCMSDPAPTVAAPDAIDLANLGVTVTAAPEPVAQEPAPQTSDTTVVSLPNTGTGAAAACRVDTC